VDGPALHVGRNRLTAVYRLAEHVENAPQRHFTHRRRDRTAGIGDVHAPRNAVRGAHGDRAHLVLSNMLLDLGHQLDRYRSAAVLDLEGIVDLGQVLRLELHVEHRADHLDDPADIVLGLGGFPFSLGCDCSCHLCLHSVCGSVPLTDGTTE
jgi:hypothetical protein